MCGRLAIRDAVGGIRPPIGISEEYNHSTEHRTKKEEEEEKTRKEENNRLEMVPQTRTPYAPVAPPRLRPLETRKDQIKYSQNEERKN